MLFHRLSVGFCFSPELALSEKVFEWARKYVKLFRCERLLGKRKLQVNDCSMLMQWHLEHAKQIYFLITYLAHG